MRDSRPAGKITIFKFCDILSLSQFIFKQNILTLSKMITASWSWYVGLHISGAFEWYMTCDVVVCPCPCTLALIILVRLKKVKLFISDVQMYSVSAWCMCRRCRKVTEDVQSLAHRCRKIIHRSTFEIYLLRQNRTYDHIRTSIVECGIGWNLSLETCNAPVKLDPLNQKELRNSVGHVRISKPCVVHHGGLHKMDEYWFSWSGESWERLMAFCKTLLNTKLLFR